MNNARKTFLGLLLMAFLLSACAGQQVPESPTLDINAIMTQSVGTVAAQFFQTQTAMVTPATPTPLNTPTFIPTNTALALPSPLPSATYVYYATIAPTITSTGTQYTPTTNPSSLASGCNNLALLRDENYPSGTEVKAGASFTKTWKVANTGTCEWTLRYQIVFISGTDMGYTPSGPKNTIPAGKWTQLDLPLVAPSKAGTYTGYWQLSDGAGKTFGSLLGVSIVVKDSSYP
jgi:hypothetical protein